MALRDALIGVGPALRKARELRGVTLDEASRDTKLRVELLDALEGERFDAMSGEVYVRGSLRTYSRYLGLDPEKVAAAYARHADELEPPPPPAKLGRVERAIAATRVRDNQRLMVFAAGAVLVVAVVFGILNRGRAAPPPASLPSVASVPAALDRTIDVVLEATGEIQATVTADGIMSTYEMARGETRTFTADSTLRVEVDDGGAVHVTVNGNDRGIPGSPGLPWSDTFSFGSTADPGSSLGS
jgi:cytoskeletal protein RodZ